MDIKFSDLLSENFVEEHYYDRIEQKPIPYPQANSLDCIFEVVQLLTDSGISIYDLLRNDLLKTERQASYYCNAAAFLGFCFKRGRYFYPTERKKIIDKCDESEKRARFASLVLTWPEFTPLYVGIFALRDKDEQIAWLRQQVACQCKSEATINRRASCILAWIAWVQKNLPQIKD